MEPLAQAHDPIEDELRQWPVDRAAVGWILDGRFHRVGPSDEAFALASVTKPLFAVAVLVAIEEGTLSLDQPVPTGTAPEGATVRHLLSHASGLGLEEDSPRTAVATKRIYSNAGFDLLGSMLSTHSGMPAAEYLRLAVVEPLGMTATELQGSPARDAVSSVDDLLRLCAELLDPTLISPVTIEAARTSQFPSLNGVLPGFGRYEPNPWGLGFEIRGDKAPHWTPHDANPATFGHFGQAGTMLWVDPIRRVACTALANRAFGPWAKAAWPRLGDRVLMT